MRKSIIDKNKNFKVLLNGRKVLAYKGETILSLARRNNVKIPSFCHHPDLSIKANCRVCVVEVKNYLKLKTSCSTIVEEGMEIITDSERVKKARETNLELIYASHIERCGTCSFRFECDLLKTAKEYNLNINKFKDRKKKRKTYKFANAVEIDGSQCIDCRNCVEACSNQGISYLEVSGSGINQEIKPKKNENFACVYCGQCSLHCPVASAQEQDQSLELSKLLEKKDKILIAQFAPAIRTSLGEMFSLNPGDNCEGKIITALRKLGFDYVFDINFGADITTITEAHEFIERANDEKNVWPMTTSCCPAWVAYAEFYHPEILKHLTNSRSPHLHSAGAIKTYWAKEKNVKAEDVIVVSIVPCTAKKYEANREELRYRGSNLVDFVLTTRELSFLIKRKRIDFLGLEDGVIDDLFNHGSGSAAIYGASGGVMESAIRTISYILNGNKKTKIDLNFKEKKGVKGVKEAKLKMVGKVYKLAIVDGLINFSKIWPSFYDYHYIEVMACPGGCVGGGGQPIPTNKEIVKKRANGLYKIDKKRKIREAYENKEALDFCQFVKNNNLSEKIIYTKFKKSKGSILTTSKDNN